jgi:O-antigen ligase
MALFLIGGVAVSGSSGGFALLVPSALGAYLIYRRAAAGPLSRIWLVVIGAAFATFLAVAAMGPLNQQTLSDKFSDHPTSRGTIWTNTSRAVAEFMPVGSGLGSFGAVYRTFDNPNRTTNEFVNHAHNDYLEVALELGVPGILLVLGFFIWWALRSWRSWQDDFHGANVARCGSVITAVLLLHSVADYPLRTSALAAVFALGCAFLVPPFARRAREKVLDEPETGGLKHLEAD